MSAVSSICDRFSVHPIITDIQGGMNFCWVPSQFGIDGNERADAAARKVAF